MRKVSKKVTDASELKLDVITNRIISSGKEVKRLRDEAKILKSDIEDNEKLSKKIRKNKDLAEQELKDSKILLSKMKQTISVTSKTLREAKYELEEMEKSKEDMKKEIDIAALEGIEKQEAYVDKFTKQKMESEGIIEDLSNKDQLLNEDIISKKENIANLDEDTTVALNALDEVRGNVNVSKDELIDAENTVKDSKVDIEKINLELVGLKEEKDKLLLEIVKAKSELEDAKNKKETLKEESIKIKEGNVVLASREIELKKKENRIKGLYKKAGLTY